ncbi:UDP-3-O-(3-hydroxymyristoyl)glucosamine N-acyltransferase [Undibacterium arcticum]
MSTRLGQLVERLGGQLMGDPDIEISGIAPLNDANASHITFLANPKLRQQAAQTQAAALILSATDDTNIAGRYAGARIIVENPYAYFARTAQLFAAQSAPPIVPGIHPSAIIDPSAQVAATACIGPHVSIEADAIIGDRCIIDAGCFIGRGAVIGANTHLFARATFSRRLPDWQKNCIIHSGAVIGADGFGFANEGGTWIKIPQTGVVVIGNDVEIGVNTSIDRGALADTIIEDGVKLDNQIQIGHNCHIGAHTAMAGCVGVAGSAQIGKYCTFGGAAMVLGHLTIVDHVHISSGSMVSRSILEAGQYTGFFIHCQKCRLGKKSAAIVRNLSSMREKIRKLEKNH